MENFVVGLWKVFAISDESNLTGGLLRQKLGSAGVHWDCLLRQWYLSLEWLQRDDSCCYCCFSHPLLEASTHPDEEFLASTVRDMTTQHHTLSVVSQSFSLNFLSSHRGHTLSLALSLTLTHADLFHLTFNFNWNELITKCSKPGHIMYEFFFRSLRLFSAQQLLLILPALSLFPTFSIQLVCIFFPAIGYSLPFITRASSIPASSIQ